MKGRVADGGSRWIQIGWQTDRQTDRQADRQTDRWAGRQDHCIEGHGDPHAVGVRQDNAATSAAG